MLTVYYLNCCFQVFRLSLLNTHTNSAANCFEVNSNTMI